MRRAAWWVALGACTGTASPKAPEPAPVVAHVMPVPVPVVAPVVEPRASSIDLAFTGDIMFGRFIEGGFRPIAAEEVDPFAQVAPLLESDLTLANLETPVMAAPPASSRSGSTMRFVTTPARIARLAPAGIGAVTIANNHYYDMKDDGVHETPALLHAANLVAIGAARAPEVPLFQVESVQVKGWRVGYIAAATVINTDHPGVERLPLADQGEIRDAILPVIAAARQDHDVVIVVMHWGVEYQDTPESWQVTAAHAWIDAGANAVIGHHPHVMQGIERYHGGVVAYSLGNFLFDNDWQIKHDSGVLHLTFASATASTPTCLADARLRPTTIERGPKGKPAYQPLPASTMHATKRIATRLQTLSSARPFRSKWRLEGDDLVATPACPAPAGAQNVEASIEKR